MTTHIDQRLVATASILIGLAGGFHALLHGIQLREQPGLLILQITDLCGQLIDLACPLQRGDLILHSLRQLCLNLSYLGACIRQLCTQLVHLLGRLLGPTNRLVALPLQHTLAPGPVLNDGQLATQQLQMQIPALHLLAEHTHTTLQIVDAAALLERNIMAGTLTSQLTLTRNMTMPMAMPMMMMMMMLITATLLPQLVLTVRCQTLGTLQQIVGHEIRIGAQCRRRRALAPAERTGQTLQILGEAHVILAQRVYLGVALLQALGKLTLLCLTRAQTTLGGFL